MIAWAPHESKLPGVARQRTTVADMWCEVIAVNGIWRWEVSELIRWISRTEPHEERWLHAVGTTNTEAEAKAAVAQWIETWQAEELVA